MAKSGFEADKGGRFIARRGSDTPRARSLGSVSTLENYDSDESQEEPAHPPLDVETVDEALSAYQQIDEDGSWLNDIRDESEEEHGQELHPNFTTIPIFTTYLSSPTSMRGRKYKSRIRGS